MLVLVLDLFEVATRLSLWMHRRGGGSLLLCHWLWGLADRPLGTVVSGNYFRDQLLVIWFFLEAIYLRK